MINKVHIKVKDRLNSDKIFNVVKHPNKTYLVTRPKPAKKEMNEYYSSKDYDSHKTNARTFSDWLYVLSRTMMLKLKGRIIKKLFTKPGRVLDIGSGTGEFLLYMKKLGWHAFGYEVSNKAKESTANKLNYIDIDHQRDRHQFDLITFWHSVEHIYDFEKSFSKISSALIKGGYVIIACPNYNSWDALYYKESWAAWDVPRHLRHFSKKSLNHELVRFGFVEVFQKPLFLDSFYVSMLSEKILNSRMPFLKGILFGFVSNAVGMLTKNFSSHIYVFKKL